MIIHPRLDIIEAYNSGDLAEAERKKVGSHLRDCSQCQSSLLFVRGLTNTAASSSDIPGMSSNLRSRVLERVESGDIGILSGDDAHVQTRRMRPAWWSLAAAVLIVAAVLVYPRKGLEAGPTAGTLQVSQASSQPERVLRVRYTPAGSVSDKAVTLRVATYTKASPFSPQEAELELSRSGDSFAGQLNLAPDVVFATYTIALNGRVDDNDARGWETVVEDGSRRPLFDGLWVQRAINGRANWERASAAAQAMMKYYPDNPTRLRYAYYDAAQLAGSVATDSVRRIFAPHAVAMHEKFASQRVDADRMWEFAMLFADMDDTVRTRFWRERMIREFPRDAGTIQQRVFAISSQRMSPAKRLEMFDALFNETGGQSIQLLADAFDIALETRDDALIAKWGDRVSAFGNGYEGGVAVQYSKIPAFRSRGENMLRESLKGLPAVASTDWKSALRHPETLSSRRPGQWQLQALGDALLADGNAMAARDTLARALTLGWSPKILRSLGEAALAVGDSAAAVEAWSWLVADVRTSTDRADSLRARLGDRARGDAWNASVKEGKTLLASMTMKSAIQRPFDNSAEYVDESGKKYQLAKSVASPISVVAFVSRHCAPSLDDLASLNSVSRRLNAMGVSVTVLTEESPSENAVKTIGARGYTGPLAFDDRGTVSRKLRQSGTPHYFVIENGSTVRFDARRAEDLIAQVEALKSRATP